MGGMIDLKTTSGGISLASVMANGGNGGQTAASGSGGNGTRGGNGGAVLQLRRRRPGRAKPRWLSTSGTITGVTNSMQLTGGTAAG